MTATRNLIGWAICMFGLTLLFWGGGHKGSAAAVYWGAGFLVIGAGVATW